MAYIMFKTEKGKYKFHKQTFKKDTLKEEKIKIANNLMTKLNESSKDKLVFIEAILAERSINDFKDKKDWEKSSIEMIERYRKIYPKDKDVFVEAFAV